MKRITPPNEEPLSLTEAKEHLRVYGGDDDAYITGLISAARSHIEAAYGLQLVPATYEQTLDRFSPVSLLKQPFRELANITYLDEYGAVQTVTNVPATEEAEAINNYYLDDYSNPPFLYWAEGMPTVYPTRHAVKIQYVAGFETVPEDIKCALLLLVGHLFENRQEELTNASLSRLAFGIDALMAPYRVYA